MQSTHRQVGFCELGLHGIAPVASLPLYYYTLLRRATGEGCHILQALRHLTAVLGVEPCTPEQGQSAHKHMLGIQQ